MVPPIVATPREGRLILGSQRLRPSEERHQFELHQISGLAGRKFDAVRRGEAL
jgi:hypothetical protein